MVTPHAVIATVSGRVQGVGFRYTTQRVGARLGLDGWVRNQHDGTVQVHVQGAADVVDRFIEFLKEGPPAARVIGVEVSEVSADTDLTGFSVTY